MRFEKITDNKIKIFFSFDDMNKIIFQGKYYFQIMPFLKILSSLF